MSSVFISNVDDYLAPSQACVNPIFAESTNQKKDEKKEEPTTTKQEEHTGAVVVPRKRRVVRKRMLETTPNTIPVPSTPAKVSMVDCLACSGCVTTAETVLVEQHSVSKLRQALQEDQQRPVVFTISPASWADLLRKLELSPSLAIQRRLATFLQQTCRAVVVLDGHVPLQWSLQEAAREFCHAFKRRHVQESTIPAPSMAVSSNRIQYADGVVVECPTRDESRIPLLTSSCPALVCLVEKSRPEAVPHLSTAKSSMSMAGAYFSPKKCFHVGIMPCHDKKLEASRKDLLQDGKQDVDLVITTQEWWTLLTDAVKSEVVADVTAYLQKLPMANVATSLKGCVENAVGVTLVVPPSDAIAGKEEDDDVIMMDADSEKYFAFGSGGYADFIFRFASKELFGYTVRGELSWTPVETPQARRIASSRVAASLKKRRDFLSVTLYRHVDGSYSSSQQSDQDVAVLQFAAAYGLQNIQRVLLSFSSSASSAAPSFDYVEAMACPSGCPNGGGQVRKGNIREIPTETRERVSKTQEVMKMQRSYDHNSNPLDYPSDLIPTGPFGSEAKRLLHTRYHVVPPLQHTMGAIAGVAVQDTNW